MKAVGKFIAFLSRMKVRHQLALVFSVAVVLPVLLLGIFVTDQMYKTFSARAYDRLESGNQHARTVLFETTLTFYNVSDTLIRDNRLQRILQTEYASSEQLSKALDEFPLVEQTMAAYTSVSSVMVYTTNPQFRGQQYICYSDEERVQAWFDRVRVPGSLIWESNEYNQAKRTPELTMVRSIPLVNAPYSAIIVLRMDNNYLKNQIQFNDQFVSLSLDREPIFFSSTRALQGTPETAPIDYEKHYFQSRGEITYNGKPALSRISTLIPYKSNCRMYITTLDFQAPGDMRNVVILCVSITLAAILLPLLVILVFSRSFSSRVHTLRDAMSDAAGGHFDNIGGFQGADELSTIYSDMQSLVHSIQQQQARIYESQLKERELTNRQQQMELRLLLSQINPHFIYNTLETIRMMALSHGAKDVATAAMLLGKTMRYVLENAFTSATTLDKELSYVTSYLAIQRLRFGDRINYTITIADGFDVSRYQILPLLLQPVVENAVVHGLEDREEGGHIDIRVGPRDGFLFLEVQDNGVGISPDKLEALRKRITLEDTGDHGGSVGLYNIACRIRLLYGEDCGLFVENDNGVRVSLRLKLVPRE